MVFSSEGQSIASGSIDGTVKFWHSKDGTVEHSLFIDEPVINLVYSPDGQHLAVLAKQKSIPPDSFIKVFALSTMTQLAMYKVDGSQKQLIDFVFRDNHLVFAETPTFERSYILNSWDFANNQISELSRQVTTSHDTEREPGIYRFTGTGKQEFLLKATYDRNTYSDPSQQTHKLLGSEIVDSFALVLTALKPHEVISFSTDLKKAVIFSKNEIQSPRLIDNEKKAKNLNRHSGPN